MGPGTSLPADTNSAAIAANVQRAYAASKAAGTPLSDADLDAYARRESGGKYGLEDLANAHAASAPTPSGPAPDTSVNMHNLGRSALQGATFGFSDEIAGQVKGDKYKEEMRANQKAFESAHPWYDAGAKILGALGLPVAMALAPESAAGAGLAGAAEGTGVWSGAARALQALRTGGGALGSIGRSAAAAGALGAAQGAGEGDTPEQREPEALIGGGSGMVAGAALPVLGSIVRRVAMPGAFANEQIADAVRSAGGPAALRAQAGAFAAAGKGADAASVALSPEMLALADKDATKRPEAKIALANMLQARQAGQSDRVLSDVSDAMGAEPNATAQLAKLQAARKAWAAGPNGYGGLRAADPVIAPQAISALAPTLKQPPVAQALAAAKRVGFLGDIRDVKRLSFGHLQDVKESLDDAVDNAFRGGNGNLGTRLGQARDQVVSFMHDNVPGYSGVAAEYARRMQLESALQAGQDAWKTADARAIGPQLAALSPDEQSQFRTGMASALWDHLGAARTNRDISQQMVDGGPALQAKLEAAFPNKTAFDRVMQQLAAERQMATSRSAVGNSATAARTAAGTDALGQALPTAALAIPGFAYGHGLGPMALTAAVTRALEARTGRLAAGQVGTALSEQGPDAIERLLATMGRPTGPGVLPAAAGSSAGAIVPPLLDGDPRTRGLMQP